MVLTVLTVTMKGLATLACKQSTLVHVLKFLSRLTQHHAVDGPAGVKAQ